MLKNKEALILHLSSIIDGSTDAIIAKTLDGIITGWNKGAELIFGYSSTETLGQSILIILPEDRKLEEISILERLKAGEHVKHFETVRKHKDGHLIHVSVTISPIMDAHGTIIGASKIARDITDRIKLEEESRQLEMIVKSSDDAIIGKSLNGVVTNWNRGAEKIFGYRAEEIIGTHFDRLIPEDRKNEEKLILQRIKQGQTVDHFETIRLRKDGSSVYVSVTISPIKDKSGRIIGASKIARDITKKRAIEKQLQLTSSVFTHTNEGIAITDSKGIIIDVNDAFVRITGYSRDDSIGKNQKFFRSSRQGPEIMAALWNSLKLTDHCQGEVWSRKKEGEAYAGLLTISTIRDLEGHVQNYVGIFADITALKNQQDRLEHIAHFDALTDLPNRVLLSDRLQQAIAMCKRHQKDIGIVYLDLDGFKYINDNFGQDIGDEFLIQISKRMKSAVREVDTVARMGGDEFVAILEDVESVQKCMDLAHRILKSCSDTIEIKGQFYKVSASIGVTMYPQDDCDAEQLLRHADQAMYEAKQTGKNRCQLFDTVQHTGIRVRSEQLDRISTALSSNEFVLYYQPKVNMRTGAVNGAEALIRWLHPEHGMQGPAVFLPTIEGHPLSDEVCEWTIVEALKQMSTWSTQGIQLSVSVNIGARQLQQKDFPKRLEKLLAMHPNINPQDLELEVLETSALEDINEVSKVMESCRRLGVHFALDDFGTGYSSLAHLKKLPAGVLKIDQSFVRDMLDDKEDLAIVQGVIGLAHAFGRNVIAEGVETVAHGSKLIALGCDFAQGYGIARPMPSFEIPLWIEKWKPFAAWAA